MNSQMITETTAMARRALPLTDAPATHPLDTVAYRSIAASAPSTNSETVRGGVPAAFIRRLASDLHLEQSLLTDSLGIARSTFSRKLKNDDMLSSGDGALALGVARLIGEVERILAESGDPASLAAGFDGGAWLGEWLRRPVGALGNRHPLAYLDNAFGQETLLQLIGRMQSGAFS